MQSPNETPQPCWSCKKQPATAKYTRGNINEMLCATCLDRMAVQDALEDRSRHIDDLENREQYDEVLACLDEILEANRHRDHDKWLARSIASDRARILFDAGRYAEAEQACKAWAEFGFENVWQRWLHGSVTAETLDALGRSREGLAVLEDALTYRDPKYLPHVWTHLAELAEISEKRGQPVDPKWRSLAQESAAWHGVEMPEHQEVGKAILELAETIREQPPKQQMRRGEGEDSDDDDEP
jgi:tetratricopeptide (TPR) repeat protein